jgi:hypothetical protein
MRLQINQKAEVLHSMAAVQFAEFFQGVSDWALGLSKVDFNGSAVLRPLSESQKDKNDPKRHCAA